MTEKSTDDIRKLRKQYEAKIPFFEQVRSAAETAIHKALDESDIKVHDVLSRVKETDSFLKKVEPRVFGEPLEDLDDIVGLRVLVLFRSDIEKVGELIKKYFKLVKEDDKTKDKEASDFSYLGTHYTVTLDPEWTGKQNTNLFDQKIEIQVRTLAMDSWATISYYLDYKQEIDIPVPLRRDFFALNGLFYVADTHFEIIHKKRKKSIAELEVKLESKSADAGSQRINLDSLTVFLKQTFPNRGHSEPGDVSELVGELEGAGITLIEQFDSLLKQAMEAFMNYEREFVDTNFFQPVGVIRRMLLLSNSDYRETLMGRNFPKHFIDRIDKWRIDK